MSEPASNSLPVVLVPGLTCTARLYADQIPAVWQFGPVTVADHRRDDSMASIARQPTNYSGRGTAIPEECKISQKSQIAPVQIAPHPGAHS
jgi:hypothetical protein